ncbi:MAG TPA: GGDEF domain-containing protein [Nocardioides sp.]|uniref:GGDEF domain-containing protein n=1 Tax=Nocardioides sp. TaxID=35761 RepID=UPI002D7E8270|nr:GGDEF domain-containing protein [Nocardioides sp.]HET6653381.1 GGDEF domain-containing protein [Nocardioides sp.]
MLSHAAAQVMTLAQDGDVEGALGLAHATLRDAGSASAAERAALWYALAVAHHADGDYEAQALAADRCLDIARGADDHGWQSNALSIRAMAHLRADRVEPALLDLARAEAALLGIEDDALACWAHTGLGYGYLELRLYELARPHFEAAVDLDASPIPLNEARAIDLLNLAELHVRWADELERALPHDSAEDEADELRAAGHDIASAALAEAQRVGAAGLAAVAGALALCSRPRAQAEASVADLRAAYESPDHNDHQGGRAVVGSSLARALWRTGRHDEALDVARQAAELSAAAGDWHVAATVRWLLVEMEHQAGLPGAASGHAYARLLSRVLWQQRLSTLQGARAALAVEGLRRDTAVAERRALEDPLTGVGNRRALDAALGRSRHEDGPWSLLVVDLDEFKTVNDRYGHLLGDEVLRGVADAIRRVARADDIVVRLGGDEFVVLARGTDEAGGSALAGRLREAIAAVTVSTPHGCVRLTATVGVGTTDDRTTATDLLEVADLDMYRGKGRRTAQGA